MIANFLKYFISGFLILMFQYISAQEPIEKSTTQSAKEINKVKKHSIHAEIGGRTFIFGSLSYEYAFKRISLGAGLGLMNINSGDDLLPNSEGNLEQASYFNTMTSQMVYVNYFIGKKKRKLYFTTGLTHFLSTSKEKTPLRNKSYTESYVGLNAGIGYQFSGKKTYFRFTGYVIGTGDGAFLPKYLPWVGISIGIKI